jgi:glycosyltransferase involved in cell wall biosynthesis
MRADANGQRGGQMRILIASHQFLPDYTGGTEILAGGVALELQRQGHEVSVITGSPCKTHLSNEQRFDSYDWMGLSVERFHHANVSMGGQTNLMEVEYNNRFFAAHFREYLRRLKPDVVHFFHLSRLSASAIDVGEEFRIPMFFTVTDFWFICPTFQLRLPDQSICAGPNEESVNCLRHLVALTQPRAISAPLNLVPDNLVRHIVRATRRKPVARLPFAGYVDALSRRAPFLREQINKLDKVLAPTRLMGEILVKHGVDPEKLLVSRYGIDLEKFSPRKTAHSEHSSLRVGFIGTIFEHKGVHILVDAIRRLDPEEKIELKVYGNVDQFPEYGTRLKRIASSDSRIKFCGTFPNEKIGEIFAGLDVLAVPSLWQENSPLVIHSAQAAGCPVIISDVRGMAEDITDGDNGLVFSPGDVHGLAKCLHTLTRDRELLRRLAGNSRRPKSIADYVRELLPLYEEALDKKSHPL